MGNFKSNITNQMQKSQKKQKHPIFNDQYEILSSLGEGNTSKVYLCRSLKNPKEMMALKLLRDEFLSRDEKSIKAVEKEIQILQGLKHGNIVNILGYGSDGTVLKPSGRKIENLVYILLEYVSGGLLFDLCQTMGGMGEDYGRFFLNQIIEVVGYMQGKGVVHRDLKLENILVDDNLNLKIADFGFATYKKIDKLKSYRGTMTYMAPEIKEGKVYNGKQIDMFSTGVILFIIVQGIFPFKEAKKDEYFYNLLLQGKLDTYWKKTGGENLSDDFKDLVLRMFNYDGKKRPTVEEIKNHPWMQTPYNVKGVKENIMERLTERRTAKTTDSSREGSSRRGDDMLQLVRQTSVSNLEIQKFNDMTDFDIQTSPGDVWEELNNFNCDYFDSQLTLENNMEKKYIKLPLPANEEENTSDLVLKIKFFDLQPQQEGEEEEQEEDEFEEPRRLRVRFTKKRGDLRRWYEIFGEMQETVFDDLLLAPRLHQEENLTAESDEQLSN